MEAQIAFNRHPTPPGTGISAAETRAENGLVFLPETERAGSSVQKRPRDAGDIGESPLVAFTREWVVVEAVALEPVSAL